MMKTELPTNGEREVQENIVAPPQLRISSRMARWELVAKMVVRAKNKEAVTISATCGNCCRRGPRNRRNRLWRVYDVSFVYS